MKILVTGANGFMGSWIARGLHENGHALRVLHRRSSDMSALEGVPHQGVLGDVTDAQSMVAACAGIDAVYHVAALIAYDKSQWDLMQQVNVEGTRNVIEACLSQKVKRLIHTSSVVTVAEAPRDPSSPAGRRPVDETAPYNMSHYRLGYFESKRAAENLVLKAAKERDLNAVVLNPAVVFGPGDGVKGSRKMHLKVAAGKFPFYVDGGTSVVHVKDVVQAQLAALEKGRSGERYILSGENLTIQELFTALAHAAGNQPPTKKLPTFAIKALGRIGDGFQKVGLKFGINSERAITSTVYLWFEHLKASRELGFNPGPASVAIGESVQWCKENGLL